MSTIKSFAKVEKTQAQSHFAENWDDKNYLP
jgi:hypothetical protein